MKYRHRKCRCCHEWFMPQAHNAYHQRYCTAPECRRASKRASQQRWFRKNRDHYRGDINIERVREWRDAHPEYARHRRSSNRLLMKLHTWPAGSRMRKIRLRIDDPKSGRLQDVFIRQPVTIAEVVLNLRCTLQDFIGISTITCYS